MSTAMNRLERIIEEAIRSAHDLDLDTGPKGLSIEIAEVLVRDWGHEVPDLIRDEMFEREYQKGWVNGQKVIPTEAAIEAVARSRWDARFGQNSWDASPEGDPDRAFSKSAFRSSAERDLKAAMYAVELYGASDE